MCFISSPSSLLFLFVIFNCSQDYSLSAMSCMIMTTLGTKLPAWNRLVCVRTIVWLSCMMKSPTTFTEVCTRDDVSEFTATPFHWHHELLCSTICSH